MSELVCGRRRLFFLRHDAKCTLGRGGGFGWSRVVTVVPGVRASRLNSQPRPLPPSAHHQHHHHQLEHTCTIDDDARKGVTTTTTKQHDLAAAAGGDSGATTARMPGGAVPVTGVDISRAAEDKLTYKLCLAAERKCADVIEAYNSCVAGRTVTAAWACKAAYRASSACIADVNQANVDELKRRWVDAGRPKRPDWAELLSGIVPPEHRALPQRPG